MTARVSRSREFPLARLTTRICRFGCASENNAPEGGLKLPVNHTTIAPAISAPISGGRIFANRGTMVSTTKTMVMLDAKTAITQGKAKIALSKVKVGDRVVASGPEEQNMIMAETLKLSTVGTMTPNAAVKPVAKK